MQGSPYNLCGPLENCLDLAYLFRLGYLPCCLAYHTQNRERTTRQRLGGSQCQIVAKASSAVTSSSPPYRPSISVQGHRQQRFWGCHARHSEWSFYYVGRPWLSISEEPTHALCAGTLTFTRRDPVWLWLQWLLLEQVEASQAARGNRPPSASKAAPPKRQGLQGLSNSQVNLSLCSPSVKFLREQGVPGLRTYPDEASVSRSKLAGLLPGVCAQGPLGLESNPKGSKQHTCWPARFGDVLESLLHHKGCRFLYVAHAKSSKIVAL